MIPVFFIRSTLSSSQCDEQRIHYKIIVTSRRSIHCCVTPTDMKQIVNEQKRKKCYEALVEKLGSDYRLNANSSIVKSESDGAVTIYFLNQRNTRVLPNGSCPVDNSPEKYDELLVKAYEGIRDSGGAAWENLERNCQAFEEQSPSWYQKVPSPRRVPAPPGGATKRDART